MNFDIDRLDEILTKAFNDFYDYITEKDIIKVAHEYSEKTVYKTAHQALQDYIKERELEARLDELTDMLYGHSRDVTLTITDKEGEEYHKENFGFISRYEVQERTQELQSLRDNKS